MKKILSLVVCMLICLSVQADDHLKFMGIPLDGTITQFQAKLAKKGVAHDVAGSKILPPGCRGFNGTFSGKKANIYVYYDTTSKVVYRAKAVIDYSDKSLCSSDYDYFVSMLSEKYYDAEKNEGKQDGYDAIIFLVPNPPDALYKYYGRIDVYRSASDSYPVYYFLHVDYTDTLNSVKHENRNMEDL